jgi:hypothetical protein
MMNAMWLPRWGMALLAVPMVCAGQADLPPELLLLARIKTHMGETLRRMPNYTCLQSIERSERRNPSKKYRTIDTIRLEVALVNSQEMFAWPGAGKFEDAKLTDIVKGGAIGNGNFALHARSVFLSNIPTFQYLGERIRGDRQTFRFDYSIPQYRSGYSLKIGEVQGTVGYHGSFWVDAGSLDLIRLEVVADEIPPHIPVSAASDVMEYARVKIGEGDFLLPASSEMSITDLQGNESRNRTQFQNCHQYTGESVLTFEDRPEDASPVSKKEPEAISLPDGIELELRLSAELNSSKDAVGDPIQATVERNVKRGGTVLVPKGAIASGRIARLEHRLSPLPHYIVGLEFSTLEFDGHRAELHGSVSSVVRPPGFHASAVRQLEYAYRTLEKSLFFEPGMRLRFSRGLRLTWRSGIASKEEKQ